MLIEIAKVIGGTVRITSKGSNVIWVVNKKEEVEEIIKIFDTYPPTPYLEEGAYGLF